VGANTWNVVLPERRFAWQSLQNFWPVRLNVLARPTVKELNSPFNCNLVACYWHNPFRVDEDLHLLPRVEATLGFGTSPLRGECKMIQKAALGD